MTSPLAGATVGSGDRVVITGTASDSGGVVAAVEVSVDGGTTWQAAQGTAAWSYEWSPGAPGPATIRARAVDDSGNQETPGAGTDGVGRRQQLPVPEPLERVDGAGDRRCGRREPGRARV